MKFSMSNDGLQQLTAFSWLFLKTKVLRHLARLILPFNSFLCRSKVLTGSTCQLSSKCCTLCFLVLLFILSSTALPGYLILHTFCLISVSLTAMLLTCSPLGLPNVFLLTLIFTDNLPSSDPGGHSRMTVITDRFGYLFLFINFYCHISCYCHVFYLSTLNNQSVSSSVQTPKYSSVRLKQYSIP